MKIERPQPIGAARPLSVPVRPAAGAPLGLLTALLAGACLAWEASGGDHWLAHLAGGGQGFALREHWFLSGVMHSDARVLAWVLVALLCLGVRWPMGPLRQLSTARRWQLAGSVLVSVLVVSLLKTANPAACPWDLVAYGGAAPAVSHWAWFAQAGSGGGHCFPAGHASAGFAFIGGWFVFRGVAPVVARRWLLAAIAAGFLLGLSQQWRGAHFMSHTLWTGWLCWSLAWAVDALQRRLVSRQAGPAVA